MKVSTYHSGARSALTAWLLLHLIALGILTMEVHGRSLFASRIASIALFGNLDSKDDQQKSPLQHQIAKPNQKVPPPPPPGRPPLPTTNQGNESSLVKQTPPPPPPPPIDKLEESTTHVPATELTGNKLLVPDPKQSASAGDSKSEINSPPQSSWSNDKLPNSFSHQVIQDSSDDVFGGEPTSQQVQRNSQGGFPAANNPSQHQYPYYQSSPNDMYWQDLNEQLEDCLYRENQLHLQVQNLTAVVLSMQEREAFHLGQINMMTDRIIDMETAVAEEHNSRLEYQNNCTDLSLEIGKLTNELGEWQQKCSDLSDQHSQYEARIKELKDTLQATSVQAEELAIAVENSRTRSQMEDKPRRKQSNGVLGWFLSFIFPAEEEDEESQKEEVENLAKSTLLRALRVERNNVDELEATVSSLQQNNSAISEMVKSRDSIIDELNARVAVFEEDKVVLKAALRQLQKEMKEEAPKTQKLLDDLSSSKEELAKLNAETESLLQVHQDEMGALQQILAQKESTVNETVSNLTMIGKYVDKLEERLASFAIARRDLEEREKKCRELEASAAEYEQMRETQSKRLDELEKERTELEKLVEELERNQSELNTEKKQLIEDKKEVVLQNEDIRESIVTMENSLRIIREEKERMEKQMELLKSECDEANDLNMELKAELQSFEAERESLRAELHSLSQAHAEARKELSLKVDILEEVQEELELKVLAEEEREKAMKEELENSRKAAENSESTAILNVSSTNSSTTSQGKNISQQFNATVRPSRTSAANMTRRHHYPRKVPLRSFRKACAKASGVHGLFTAPSKKVVFPNDRLRSQSSANTRRNHDQTQNKEVEISPVPSEKLVADDEKSPEALKPALNEKLLVSLEGTNSSSSSRAPPPPPPPPP